jgi:hypothetical protein
MLARLLLYLRPILQALTVMCLERLEGRMLKAVKKFFVKWAIRYIKRRVEDLEKREVRLRDFREKLYKVNIADFVKWGTEELVADNNIPDHYSVVDYLEQLITPLDDEIENLIVEVLRELEP